MKTWEGWIMKGGKKHTRLITGPLQSLADVQKWFRNHPVLASRHHIEFEEVDDKALVSVVIPKDYGYAGDEGDT